MNKRIIDRRGVLVGAGMLGAAAASRALAQTVPAEETTGQAVPPLPAREEFVVRGAHVLTMDTALGELPSGDVHVRDGAIVAVAASAPAPGAEVIDGRGMICMP